MLFLRVSLLLLTWLVAELIKIKVRGAPKTKGQVKTGGWLRVFDLVWVILGVFLGRTYATFRAFAYLF
jgi:hypothetical protein